jgi:serine/threonine protein kinase
VFIIFSPLVVELGRGFYANVYKGVHIISGQKFAVKAISKGSFLNYLLSNYYSDYL